MELVSMPAPLEVDWLPARINADRISLKEPLAPGLAFGAEAEEAAMLETGAVH